MSHDELKEKGNDCIKRKQFQDAVEFYTAALKENPLSHIVYSNRSLAYLKIGNLELALEDSTKCIHLAPGFARGYLRKCVALNSLGKHEDVMAVAEAGYKLRGSDVISRECVGQWVISSKALNKDNMAQVASEIGVSDDNLLPASLKVISNDCFTIYLNLFLCRLQHTSTGVEVNFVCSCIITLLQELCRHLELFGHESWPHEQEWLASYCQASKLNPSTSKVPQAVAATVLAKSDEFATWLDTAVDHALYPIVSPIFSLILLAVSARCISLNFLNTDQHVVQICCQACLLFLEKAPLTSDEYFEQHLGIYKELLEACGTSNWRLTHEEIASFKTSISKLQTLLTKFDDAKHDKEFYEKAMVSIGLARIRLEENPGFDVSSYAPASGIAVSKQAKEPEELKLYVEEKISMVQSVLDTEAAIPEVTAEDIQDLLWTIGALLSTGETKIALKAFRVAEDGLLKLFQQQLLNTAFNLDTGASVFQGPQIKILQNLASLVGVDDRMVADTVIRWKCIYSELRAILLRFGAGKEYLKTFKVLQQMNTKGLCMSESDLSSMAQEHKKESNRIMQGYGQEVIVCLFQQSCDQLQKMMRPDNLILEYCLNHPTEQPDDPKADSRLCGFLVALQPVGDALVREIDFTEVLQLAEKWSALLPTARCMKHSQEMSDIGRKMCELLIPVDVQGLISSPQVKRVFICPEASLSVLPLELLPFEDGQMLGEKCALVYLSAARELLRESVVFAISTVFDTEPSSLHDSEQVGVLPHDENTRDPKEAEGVLFKSHDLPSRRATAQEDSSESKMKECVIFADPDYKMEAISGESFWESFVTAFASAFIDSAPAAIDLVSPLPDTKKEAEEICQLLSTSEGLTVRCLMGDKATLSAALQVKSPFILHFSTHGFSKPESQAFRSTFWDDIKSGILLAGASTYREGKIKLIAAEAGTGELTSLAACGMDLQGTRLVYLSTCVSSYGSYSYGESVNSLAQAFRTAGAQTVIATLWEVHSKSAGQFASYFYEAACKIGTHPSLALSQAKKKVREETVYDDLIHWSPFVCIGEDVPLFPYTLH